MGTRDYAMMSLGMCLLTALLAASQGDWGAVAFLSGCIAALIALARKVGGAA